MYVIFISINNDSVNVMDFRSVKRGMTVFCFIKVLVCDTQKGTVPLTQLQVPQRE
jgi:hypothetical protein